MIVRDLSSVKSGLKPHFESFSHNLKSRVGHLRGGPSQDLFWINCQLFIVFEVIGSFPCRARRAVWWTRWVFCSRAVPSLPEQENIVKSNNKAFYLPLAQRSLWISAAHFVGCRTMREEALLLAWKFRVLGKLCNLNRVNFQLGFSCLRRWGKVKSLGFTLNTEKVSYLTHTLIVERP